MGYYITNAMLYQLGYGGTFNPIQYNASFQYTAEAIMAR
jgi:hypothetical protein